MADEQQKEHEREKLAQFMHRHLPVEEVRNALNQGGTEDRAAELMGVEVYELSVAAAYYRSKGEL